MGVNSGGTQSPASLPPMLGEGRGIEYRMAGKGIAGESRVEASQEDKVFCGQWIGLDTIYSRAPKAQMALGNEGCLILCHGVAPVWEDQEID